MSRIAATCMVVVALGACADIKPPNAFEQAFEDESVTWQEIQTQLPAAPQDSSLVAFAVSGGTQYRFAIDSTSLAIGTDGVFRYVLVATSPQGVRNVSYEGIRCQTRERKTYAIGRSDGTWVRARNAAWAPVEEANANRQQAALMKEYFCPDAYPARNVAEVIGRMRTRINPNTT